MDGGLREVNMELGKPIVEKAIGRLTFEIHHSRKMGVSVLKIIHGYGSSGTGGKNPFGRKTASAVHAVPRRNQRDDPRGTVFYF